jgi:hypothetical protein
MMRSTRSDTSLDVSQLIIAAAGALLVGVLYLALRGFLTIGPPWLLLAIELVLLAPSLVSALLLRRTLPFVVARGLALTLLLVVAASLVGSLALLLHNLLLFTSTTELLRQAGLLWAINVLVFATWFWEIDGNGPRERRLAGHRAADFLFPQQVGGNPTGWEPGFIDYLFLAFCFATALSPADTPPLSRRAKLLMIVEALMSLLIVVVLVGRSINIGR